LQAEISDNWSISATAVPMKQPQTTSYHTPFVDNLPGTVIVYLIIYSNTCTIH